jgi:Tat protein translocase TatB subunit
MFDIGGWEFLFILVLALIVVGPRELPGAIKAVTSWIRKVRVLARDFQSGLDDIAREVELEKVEQEIQAKLNLDEFRDSANSIREDIETRIDSDDEIERAFDESHRFFDNPEDSFDVDPDEDEDAMRREVAERRRRLSEQTPVRDGAPGDDVSEDDDRDGESGSPRARAGS